MTERYTFRVLGPFEVLLDGQTADLGGRKPAQVLALLVLHANELVSTDRLVEELWSGDPPRTARKSLQVHISRLRRVLDDGMLETQQHGYALRVEPRQLDANVFEGLVDRARAALQAERAEEASSLLRDALALWRGPALAGMDNAPFAVPYAARLDDLRLAALELRIDADLALGRHTSVVGELEKLVAEHPLRESFRRQLMLALYRAGRQGEALGAYRDARRTLVEELGVEPGPQLRELEAALLRQDPALLAPTARSAKPNRSGRRIVAAGVMGSVAVAAAVVALVLRSDDASPVVVPNSLIRIDPASDSVRAVKRVGRDPDQVAAGAGAVWVVNRRDRTVTRVAFSGGVDTIGGVTYADHVAADRRDVWVSSFDRASVARIDGDSGEVAETVGIPSQHAEGLTVGGGFLWITNPATVRAQGVETVSRLDLRSHEVVSTIRVGKTPIFTTFGYGAVWVSNYDDDTVSVISPGETSAHTVRVADGPLGIAAGYGSIWVVCYWERVLVRIDATTRRVVGRIRVGEGPLAVATGAGGVWVTNRDSRSVLRIDPRTNTIAATVLLDPPSSPMGVVVADGSAWVSIRQCGQPPCV